VDGASVAALEMKEWKAFGDVTRCRAAECPDKVALRFEGRETDFGSFERYTNQVANALLAMGLRRGDRIAHLGKNTDRYFEAMFGAAKVGAVMVPVNWRLAVPEIIYIVNDCAAKILFVGSEFVELVRGMAPGLTSVQRIIAIEGETGDYQAFESWRDAQSAASSSIAIGPDDIAIQLYTSGTTGRPKGVMLTHRNFFELRRTDDEPIWMRWYDDEIALVAMPIFHIGGSGFGFMALYKGATAVVAREFDVNGILDYIERDRISKVFLVPAAMQFIVRHPKARSVDYSRIRHIFYGAAPMPAELLRECIEVFGCGFVQMYGMTETCGTIVALPPEDHDPKGTPRMRSAGKALPGVELAILDAAGNKLSPREIGEIATRSSANMAGYWNLPEATAATVDKEGWLRTGDAGYMDEDGYLYIHDRVKDMIVSGGENVYPAEVENAIFGHPDVADVAVIGVPDEKWGESVKAFVVLKPGKELRVDDILVWARERIAGYKLPKTIETLEALPRNPSGKILRRELRDPFWRGRERQVN
jgi:acyl-CoA synthetase (AMP-forming)/AMP-acid ligase II